MCAATRATSAATVAVITTPVSDESQDLFKCCHETNSFSFENVQKSIEAGAKVNHVDPETGLTPLFALCLNTSLRAQDLRSSIRLLIEHGAKTVLDDVTIKEKLQGTPEDWSVTIQHYLDETVELLVDADEIALQKEQTNKLFEFCAQDVFDVEAIQKAAQDGANLNGYNDDGNPPLFVLATKAFRNDNLFLNIDSLIHLGADIQHRNMSGRDLMCFVLEHFLKNPPPDEERKKAVKYLKSLLKDLYSKGLRAVPLEHQGELIDPETIAHRFRDDDGMLPFIQSLKPWFFEGVY